MQKPYKRWPFTLRFVYALFLIGRFVALVIFVIRIIYCGKEKKTSFQCGNGAFIAHDLEVEMAWIISSIINLAIALKVLFTWHKYSGIKPLFLKLAKLPGFWSLFALVFLYFVGGVIIMIINKTTLLQSMLICLFSVQNAGITMTVAILSYTRVSHFVGGYRKSFRYLVKLTLLLFFVEFLMLFLIGSVQLGLQVTGLGRLGIEWAPADFLSDSSVRHGYLLLPYPAFLVDQNFCWRSKHSKSHGRHRHRLMCDNEHGIPWTA